MGHLLAFRGEAITVPSETAARVFRRHEVLSP